MRLVASLLFLSQALVAQLPPGNWLLTSEREIQAAKEKAAKFPWARKALDRLIASADHALKDRTEVPDRGGQWPHWYSCKRDGARLRTESPTRHRCPVCGEVYSGEPYDSVVLYGVHSRFSNYIRDCGLAYRFTGKPEYAQRAGELLKAYADRYASYPLHNTRGEAAIGGGKIMAQTLDESVWLIPAAWGYALVRDTLSEADRKHVEQDLFLAAAAVIRQHKMGIHNIQCWKNSAVALAGYVAGEMDLVREAIEDPDRGFLAQIDKGVTREGLWWEGSLGYHYYTMSAVWPLAEAAYHNGRNLYSERFRRLWDAPLLLSFPNGDSPGFNDNAGGNVERAAPVYEIAYARWKQPEYGALAAHSPRDSLQALLYGLDELPSGPYVSTRSALLEDAGFAVLRQGNLAAAMRFGRHGGGHGHPDKLNLVTFAKGAILGLDPGSIDYGAPLHQQWYRTTVAHNTVVVDGKNQSARDGRLEQWKTGKDFTMISASAGEVYPGVRLRRTVTLRQNGVIEDRFECASESEHVFDWAFHAQGTFASSLEFAPREVPLGTENGYQHMKAVASATTSGPFWVRWEHDGVTLTLEFQGAPGTEVIRAVGPGRDPTDRVPMILVRRKAASTVFEAIHRYR